MQKALAQSTKVFNVIHVETSAGKKKIEYPEHLTSVITQSLKQKHEKLPSQSRGAKLASMLSFRSHLQNQDEYKESDSPMPLLIRL